MRAPARAVLGRVQDLLRRRGVLLRRQAPEADVQRLVELLAVTPCAVPLVRVGPPSDGGYLVPDDLQGVSACLSPGVGGVWGFEDDLLTRFGIPSHLADRGPAVAGCPHPVTEAWLGPADDEGVVTLARWVDLVAPAGDLLLQMDVEGAEYGILLATPLDTLRRFRVVVLELHHLPLVEERGFLHQVALPALERLRTVFDVVHLHPNNAGGMHPVRGLDVPELLEVTLLRRDRARAGGGAVRLPHPLDRPCLTGRPDLTLTQRWVSQV